MQPNKVNLVPLAARAILFCITALAVPSDQWLTASSDRGRGNSEPSSASL